MRLRGLLIALFISALGWLVVLYSVRAVYRAVYRAIYLTFWR